MSLYGKSRAQILAGSTSFWGGERHTGSGVIQGFGSPITVRYAGGAIVREQPFIAATAVLRKEAVALDRRGNPVSPVRAVLCKRQCGHISASQKAGIPLDVIDPGKKSMVYILLGSTPDVPLMPKDCFKSVKPCKTSDSSCGTCCNNKKKRKAH